MSDGKVLINKEGKFLRYNEISSHGPGTWYMAKWVKMLNDASVIRSSTELSRLQWKEENPLDTAVSEINATVVRTVKLVK